MKTLIYLFLALSLSATGVHLFDASPPSTAEPFLPDTSASAVTLQLPSTSVYHVNSEWTDQEGSKVSWYSLQGRPRLVAFFYTHCGFACPRIVHDLKGILSDVPDNGDRAVGVVLVSIDPEHDTPEALNGFAARHGLDRPQWNLLRGTDAAARELAAVLGARYKQQPSGEFAHSNTIVLLDSDGNIAARRDNPDEGVEAIVEVLAAAE